MSVITSDLLNQVKNHELEAFGMNKTLLSRISALDDFLEVAYTVRCPEPYDHLTRRDLIRIFNVIAKELYGNGCPVVVEFGSFVMGMFSSDSDLDLSINFNSRTVEMPKKQRVNALRKFAKKFRQLQSKRLVKNVQLIPTARVPVLKVTDCGTGIECDFSVENRDGITKSHIIFIIATIDERLRKLSLMLKAWAKAHSINSSKDGTLNSLSLILLAAFHLQCTTPPILPPFSALFKDGFDPPTVMKNVTPYMNYGQKNKESLLQLFVTLLIRLKSVETLWSEGLCASVYTGSWIYKTFKNKLGISVEDFTDQSQNVARALHSSKVSNVYQSIEKSLTQINDFVDGKFERQELEKLLFGPRPHRMTDQVLTLDQCAPLPPILHEPTPTTKEIQVAPEKEGVLLEPIPAKKEIQLAPEKEGVLLESIPSKKEIQVAPENEGNAPPSKRVRTHDRTAPSHPVLHDPSPKKKMRLTEKKRNKKKNRKGTATSNINQPRQRFSPRMVGTWQEGRRMTQDAEAFDRRGNYATQNPSIYMHRAEGIRVHEMHRAPPFPHEASSPQSLVRIPPTSPYIPFDRSSYSTPGIPAAFRNVPLHHPPQFAAEHPPLQDLSFDIYSQQAARGFYRTQQVPYPGRVEHNRTSEVLHPGRLEQTRWDYSNEVHRQVPYYTGQPQAWSDHQNAVPRGAHRPPYYYR